LDEREIPLLVSHREGVAVLSAEVGFFVASPFRMEPLPVNWRMNSSSGFEVAVFSGC
jgi:hypothetical protein